MPNLERDEELERNSEREERERASEKNEEGEPVILCSTSRLIAQTNPGGVLLDGAMGDQGVPERKPPAASMRIRRETWQRAEEVAEAVLKRIRPTAESDERRKAVAGYVQKLFSGAAVAEVLPFGSVPLKTYLPDGDIDLTAINWNYPESSFACYIFSALKSDIYNKDSPFEVKDVQFIDAEVKLVKCFIENIVVDISFNQMGGLTSLFFLETIDRQIGNDHLFKRSIVLIKSWCYYESRILGGQHGLISTYALETLILYIFNMFHKSLTGPIGALYKFLDYFSKFNWENYALSLHGPVALSSLPNSLAVSPDSVHADVLLSKESIKSFLASFSLLPGSPANNKPSVFLMKHMNIVDPLKVTNNLGRSVAKGNFCRIRSALAFGARKLEEALMVPEELVHRELCAFFVNSINRNQRRARPNMQAVLSTGSTIPGLHHRGFELSSLKIECAPSLVSVPTDGASGSKIGPESSNSTYRNELKSQTMPCCIDFIRRATQIDGKIVLADKSVAKEEDGNGGILQWNDLVDLTGDLEMHVRYLEACYGYGMRNGQFFTPTFQGPNETTLGLEPKVSGHDQFVFLPMNPNAPILGLVPPLVTVSESTQETVQVQEMNTYNSRGSYPYACGIQSQVPSSQPFKAKAKSSSTATCVGLNWHEKVTEASPSTAKLLRELDEGKRSKSTRTLSAALFPQANGSTHQPKGRIMVGQPVSYPHEYVRRPITSKCQAMESQRTNQSFRPTQSYELKNDGDFPPLAGQVELKNSSLAQRRQPQSGN